MGADDNDNLYVKLLLKSRDPAPAAADDRTPDLADVDGPPPPANATDAEALLSDQIRELHFHLAALEHDVRDLKLAQRESSNRPASVATPAAAAPAPAVKPPQPPAPPQPEKPKLPKAKTIGPDVAPKTSSPRPIKRTPPGPKPPAKRVVGPPPPANGVPAQTVRKSVTAGDTGRLVNVSDPEERLETYNALRRMGAPIAEDEYAKTERQARLAQARRRLAATTGRNENER